MDRHEAHAEAELEAALGYRFSKPDLLTEALTHASAATRPGSSTYERLEFLGDRVLGLVIAEALFHRFPDAPEGDLAQRLAALVSRNALARVAEKLDLAGYLKMPAGETRAGTHRRPTILADCCEALVGALYLDGGLRAVRRFILEHWKPLLEQEPPREAKTLLQERIQAEGKPLPSYRIVRSEGPAHQPVFTVEVAVEGFPPARAKAGSKRVAEQEAARVLLSRLDDAAASRDGG